MEIWGWGSGEMPAGTAVKLPNEIVSGMRLASILYGS